MAAELLAAVGGFHRHRAQHHPRYRHWIQDRPGHFPGIGPDLPPAPAQLHRQAIDGYASAEAARVRVP